jgi:PKD repeat protein
VTNSLGVTSTDDIKVYFPEVLQMQDTIICAGDTVYWDLKLPQNDYSYQWFKDGEEYNDEYHYLSIFEEGAYNCLITDSLGCSFITDTMHLAIDNYEHTVSFENADTTLCYGNRLHLSSNYEETASAIWNDGTTDLEHYLSQPGAYTVTTTNNRGCQAVNTINVNLQGQVPMPNFSTEGHCQNIPINIIDLSTSEIGDISTHRWFANDSLIGTDENASHTFTEYGQQNIKLYLETTDNCANDTTISVYIDPEPQPDFTPKFFCQNALTEIHTQSSIAEGNVTGHSWIINGEPQTGDNITAMFSSNGINTLTLSAESELGCVSTKTFEVNVQQADMPRMGISGICVGHETEFINETPFNNINPQTAWEWNFGDESESSSSRNAVHTYDSIGTYDISLAVTYANRCTTSIDTTITIHGLPDAIISTHNGCIGAETILEAEISSSDNIAEYKWQIDSIFISREAQPTFVADTTGTFAITLDIKTEYACSSQATDSITIYENPSIMFTQSRDWGGNPLFVEFENTSNGATSYHWDFGGMGESTQPNPYFIFTAAGTYNVTLAGTSPEGCTSHYTSTAITVVEPIVDIMLMNLKTTIENSFAKISFVIVNLGTLPVEDLVLELKVDDRALRESIDYIAQGEVRPYTFGMQIPVPQSNNIKSTICVEAIVPDTEGHSDTNLTNNILCITDAENLSVGIPYPIPASEQITCDIYTKIPTDLDISIFNIFGKLVKHEQISQHKGYLKYVVNVMDLASGMYFIRVNSKDESITHKFEIR